MCNGIVGTVAEWLIEELSGYDNANLFFTDTLAEFDEDGNLENLNYSLYLLYEAQKDKSSELLDRIQLSRNGLLSAL